MTLPLILLWLLIYLPYMLCLPAYFARLPLSPCFSSTATQGLLLLLWLFGSRAVIPSRIVEPDPAFTSASQAASTNAGFQLPPDVKFQPSPRLLHHELENPPMLQTLQGMFAEKRQFYSLCAWCPISFADFSFMWQETAVCVEGSLFLELSPFPFLETDLSVTPVGLKSPGVNKTSQRSISSIRLYFYIHKKHLDHF